MRIISLEDTLFTSTIILPARITLIQNAIAPFPLPIREATGFLLTGTDVNIEKYICADLPNPRLKTLRHDSNCLNINFPDSLACIAY